MKTYHSFIQPGEGPLCAVLSTKPTGWLSARRDLLSCSPECFAWGSAEPGAALLSVSILSDHFAGAGGPTGLSDGLALCLHRSFLFSFVAAQPFAGFVINTAELRQKISLTSGNHEEPLALVIAAVLARDMRARGGIPLNQRMPSFEVIRIRYLSTLIAGIGCSPHFAEHVLDVAHARDLYNSLSK